MCEKSGGSGTLLDLSSGLTAPIKLDNGGQSNNVGTEILWQHNRGEVLTMSDRHDFHTVFHLSCLRHRHIAMMQVTLTASQGRAQGTHSVGICDILFLRWSSKCIFLWNPHFYSQCFPPCLFQRKVLHLSVKCKYVLMEWGARACVCECAGNCLKLQVAVFTAPLNEGTQSSVFFFFHRGLANSHAMNLCCNLILRKEIEVKLWRFFSLCH